MFENVEFLRDQKNAAVFLKKYAGIGKFFIFTDCFEVIYVRCPVRIYLVFVFPKGQYGSEYGSESDSMKKEKQNNPN